ncbi:MAG TPA: nitroreductase family protein [Candidatus Hydrogenedentes bacterium]|nr:nitroreductase family protein [Candidatus Hydrogenedentota bacterium]
MTFDEIIQARRSVRAYDSRPVDPRDIVAMCEAARWAPSASNSQPIRIIAVTDRSTIERLAKEAMGPVAGNRWVREVPLLLVGCAQLDIVTNRIGAGITGIEYYQIDFGIAMEHLVLKATELGLGTCWLGWINTERTKVILDIPSNVRVMAMMAVGYPADAPPKKRSRKPLEKLLFSERWGTSFPTNK